jgi:hypothetical protein
LHVSWTFAGNPSHAVMTFDVLILRSHRYLGGPTGRRGPSSPLGAGLYSDVFIAVILVILPLPWHYRTKNIGTSSLIFWLVQGNIFLGINAIVRMDNVWASTCFTVISLSIRRRAPLLVYHSSRTRNGQVPPFRLLEYSVLFQRHSAQCTIKSVLHRPAPLQKLGNERREKIFDFAIWIVLPWIYTALRMFKPIC